MLKSIEIQDIPEKELDNIPNNIEYKAIFQSKGMFDRTKTDYLFLISEETAPEDTLRCFGYVYNGTAPDCSEFGYFGLNKDKSQRIW